MNGMSSIVKAVTRWMTGFILLYGIWLVVYGHLSPGGGFPGGVILACSYILVMLAFGKAGADAMMPPRASKALDSVGALAFLALAVLGLWLAADGRFFGNFLQQRSPGHEFEVLNSGVIPLANLAIALKVAMSLVVAYGIMAACRLPGGGRFDSIEEE